MGHFDFRHLAFEPAPMSARQAKRLAKQLAATKIAHASEDEDVESDSEEASTWQPTRSTAGFGFLADSDSDSDSEADSDAEAEAAKAKEENESGNEADDGEAVGEAEAEGIDEQVAVPKESKDQVSRSKKKKAKRKGKKAGKGGNARVVEEAWSDEEKTNTILDALLSSVKNETSKDAACEHDEPTLFGVQLNAIDADREMQRIFGIREARTDAGNQNNGGGRRLDPRQVARKKTKKVSLVSPQDDWPRPPTFVGGGIRWTRANVPAGTGWSKRAKYFEVSWSIAYKKAQHEFEVLQQTHDPNVIGHFLNRYPYHIDALLQMTEVFQHHGQMDHASDCLKRCVYALELAWADYFDVTTGDCRMDIHVEHNDGFYRALFLLMKQVGRRGCMRSAFETAKLLLGLDPQGDPMNVLLAIDYYAVSARQYSFVIDLCEAHLQAVNRFEEKESSSARQPKKAYISTSSESVFVLPNLQFSLALAHYFMDNKDKAVQHLAQTLLRYPTVLKPLLDKIAANTSTASWQSVLGSRAFANAKTIDEDGALQHVLEIYVTRNFTLWKVNEIQSFLLRGAQLAAESSDLALANPQVIELPLSLLKYKRSYPGDYSDEITTLPPDHPMLQPAGVNINLNDLNDEQRAQLEHLQAEAEAGNLPADANPLLLFLQTLLPWNRVQRPNHAPADQDQH